MNSKHQVAFAGEDGVDAGGVFRDAMTRIADDLFSQHFDLLIPCPNAKHGAGQNNDKYLPNPQHCSPLALAQFTFVGKLMGISLRTRLCMSFELPSLVWKGLTGFAIDLADLRAIDTISCQFLEAVRGEQCSSSSSDHGVKSDSNSDSDTIGAAERAFEELYGGKLVFTYTGSDGVEKELIPGGRTKSVTFSNRCLYCDLVQSKRLHEFDAQIAAMQHGLAQIVPLSVLRLYTWEQLEVAVAGDPAFVRQIYKAALPMCAIQHSTLLLCTKLLRANISACFWWRDHTDYKGFKADSHAIKLFWQVMESLTPQEQSGFVRFAWGRSRLPSKAHWTTNMK
eukprot:3454-Heterococcus_DN1.PRE.1